MRIMTESDRTVIIGRTGGGKTYGGLWMLSLQPIDQFRWIIFDWKRDEQIARIPYTVPLSLDDDVPADPGLYIVRPNSQDEVRVDEFLTRVWEAGDTGLFIDEGMFLKGSIAFRNIMFQGRSKRIPCITLTQLPVQLPRPVFTEATFIQVFYVVDRRYQKIIEEFTPLTDDDIETLGKKRYYSWYYDAIEHDVTLLKPAPSIESTMARFEEMLRPPDDINGESQENSQKEKFVRRPL